MTRLLLYSFYHYCAQIYLYFIFCSIVIFYFLLFYDFVLDSLFLCSLLMCVINDCFERDVTQMMIMDVLSVCSCIYFAKWVCAIVCRFVCARAHVCVGHVSGLGCVLELHHLFLVLARWWQPCFYFAHQTIYDVDFIVSQKCSWKWSNYWVY